MPNYTTINRQHFYLMYLYVFPLIFQSRDIACTDKIAPTDGQTNGRRDLLIFQKFIYNTSDIFDLQIQKISFHANA